MADSWKLVLPCSRAEAEAIEAADELPGLTNPPVLLTYESDPDRPDEWQLEAFFPARPSASAIAAIRTLAPSAARRTVQVERIADQDWVTLSQAGLEPIAAGRFFIHTAAHAAAVPSDAIALRIEAGRAFGTGQHDTTAGCLWAIERLARQGRRFDRILDLGTGTGLLAFAASRVWPRAHIIASDIDPVSIEVAATNATANRIARGRRPGQVELRVAAGLGDRRITAAPYGLILANILAAPLVELSPAIARALVPGGSLVLAGLLTSQAGDVAAAYRRQGLRIEHREDRGDWAILSLRRPGFRLRG
ncbi:MAG TPA: 50S ribosomal protein L11 methyltransferase [Reyranella sp.]